MKIQSPSMERIRLAEDIADLIAASPAEMLPEETLLEEAREVWGLDATSAEEFLYLGRFSVEKVEGKTFLTY